MQIDDIFLFLGVGFLSIGALLIYIPAGFITLGVCFIALAYFFAKSLIN